ncbi:hypothetical protein Tco_0237941 [Tanacetum coccineum]
MPKLSRKAMLAYGFEIVQTFIVDIELDTRVKKPTNEINAGQKNKSGWGTKRTATEAVWGLKKPEERRPRNSSCSFVANPRKLFSEIPMKDGTGPTAARAPCVIPQSLHPCLSPPPSLAPPRPPPAPPPPSGIGTGILHGVKRWSLQPSFQPQPEVAKDSGQWGSIES